MSKNIFKHYNLILFISLFLVILGVFVTEIILDKYQIYIPIMLFLSAIIASLIATYPYNVAKGTNKANTYFNRKDNTNINEEPSEKMVIYTKVFGILILVAYLLIFVIMYFFI